MPPAADVLGVVVADFWTGTFIIFRFAVALMLDQEAARTDRTMHVIRRVELAIGDAHGRPDATV
jgi:hypothetical protein